GKEVQLKQPPWPDLRLHRRADEIHTQQGEHETKRIACNKRIGDELPDPSAVDALCLERAIAKNSLRYIRRERQTQQDDDVDRGTGEHNGAHCASKWWKAGLAGRTSCHNFCSSSKR